MKILSKLDNTGMIEEVSDKRYVTDAEKATWNSKPDTDTVTTINGKTGAITKADITALGIPASDTNTTYSEITTAEIDAGTSSTLRTITGRRIKYTLDKVQGWIGNLTKADVGLSNVDNVKQATKVEFNEHKAEIASQNKLGHVKVDGSTIVINEDGKISVRNPNPDDNSGSPGSKILLSGTMEEGFFGEVAASELITGDALAGLVGISAGTSQHSTAGWLKFAYKGEILFVAKKPIRHSISWNALSAASCVYGNKEVMIGGKPYKIALMRALEPSNDPKTIASANNGTANHHSEWNRLMCQIHEQALNKSWNHPNNIESDIGILEHSLGNGSQRMYNDADLIVGSGNGNYSWCQEMASASSARLNRGGSGLTHSAAYQSTAASVGPGWRPVLRWVEED